MLHCRRNPDCAHRSIRSVRGRVIAHATRTEGHLFWRKKYEGVVIHINDDQRVELARYHDTITMLNTSNTLGHLPDPFNIFLADMKVEEFPVGANVGVTFSYANNIGQFFFGADPIRLEKLVNLDTGNEPLKNEILPTQLDLVLSA